MNKKIITILLIILFILILVLLNIFLNNQNKVNLGNTLNEIKNEEENEMEILKVTSSNFEEEVLKSEKTVLIDFYADWCGPCKMLSPIVEEVAKENKEIKVVKIDVDGAQDLAINYEIMSIPTLVVIKNGQETNRIIGVVDKSEILNLIK